MRPEVIEEFAHDMRYFNTFGGNAVSISAAQAVLDVVREEHLQDNARIVGESLRGMLRELAPRHPAIDDVRGAGLFIGVELCVPGTDREPDEALALRVVNGLRERHVLLGTAGIDNNILKVRPPIVFSQTDAERFVAELSSTLADVGR
jgi:4-aminobutyrate aminotransferase-like enzyme